MSVVFFVAFLVILLIEFIFLYVLDKRSYHVDCPECRHIKYHMNHMRDGYVKKASESMFQGAMRGGAIGLMTGGMSGAVTTGAIMCVISPIMSLLEERAKLCEDCSLL